MRRKGNYVAPIQDKLDELEILYPIEKGFYHMCANNTEEGGKLSDDEAQAMFMFSLKALINDPVYVYTECTEDYTIVVGIDRSKYSEIEDQ